MTLLKYLREQFLDNEKNFKYEKDVTKNKCVDIMVKLATGKIKVEDVAFGENQPLDQKVAKAVRMVTNTMGLGLNTTGVGVQSVDANVNLMEDFGFPSLYVDYVQCVASPAKFTEVQGRIHDAFNVNPKLDRDNMTKALQNYKVLQMAYDKKSESRWFRFKTHLFGKSAKMKSDLENAKRFMQDKGITPNEMMYAAEAKWDYEAIRTVTNDNPVILAAENPIVENNVRTNVVLEDVNNTQPMVENEVQNQPELAANTVEQEENILEAHN